MWVVSGVLRRACRTLRARVSCGVLVQDLGPVKSLHLPCVVIGVSVSSCRAGADTADRADRSIRLGAMSRFRSGDGRRFSSIGRGASTSAILASRETANGSAGLRTCAGADMVVVPLLGETMGLRAGLHELLVRYTPWHIQCGSTGRSYLCPLAVLLSNASSDAMRRYIRSFSYCQLSRSATKA